MRAASFMWERGAPGLVRLFHLSCGWEREGGNVRGAPQSPLCRLARDMTARRISLRWARRPTDVRGSPVYTVRDLWYVSNLSVWAPVIGEAGVVLFAA